MFTTTPLLLGITGLGNVGATGWSVAGACARQQAEIARMVTRIKPKGRMDSLLPLRQ